MLKCAYMGKYMSVHVGSWSWRSGSCEPHSQHGSWELNSWPLQEELKAAFYPSTLIFESASLGEAGNSSIQLDWLASELQESPCLLPSTRTTDLWALCDKFRCSWAYMTNTLPLGYLLSPSWWAFPLVRAVKYDLPSSPRSVWIVSVLLGWYSSLHYSHYR